MAKCHKMITILGMHLHVAFKTAKFHTFVTGNLDLFIFYDSVLPIEGSILLKQKEIEYYVILESFEI